MSVVKGSSFLRAALRAGAGAVAIVTACVCLPAAAQSTWLPTTGTVPWTSGTNWSGGNVPNAVGAVANFFNGGSGASLIATSVTTGTITMTGTTGNIVIGDAATSDDVVTLAVTSGTPVVNVTSGNCNLFMYANVEGTQGITKNGAGNFSFRFNGNAQNYSGPIAINGGVFTINQDSSLGNADNDITIAGGARLAVSPGSNTGTVTLPSTRTITLSSGTGQIGVTHGAVSAVVEGTVGGVGGLSKVDPGNVTINGAVTYQGDTRVSGGIMTFTTGSFTTSTGNVNVSGTAIGGVGASLNLGSLSAVTVNGPTKTIVVQPATTASGTITSDLTLSATTNTLTVASITAGGAQGTSQGASNLGRMLLGAANVINTGSIGVGGFNARGEISFQPGLASRAVTFRGVAGGSSEVANVDIGSTSSGSRSGGGVVNLNSGTVDALFGNVTMGRHIANATLDSTSSFSFDAGTVATSGTLLMGLMTGTGNASITTLFTQGGGTSTVREIRFGQNTVATSAPVVSATYALNGGSLFVATVTNGTGAMGATARRTLSINGGTLRNYDASTDLTVNGLDGTAAGLVNIPIGASGGTVQVDAGRTATFGQFAALGGTGALTKSGTGSLVIAGTGGYAGAIAVNAGSLLVNGGLPSASAVTVASGALLGGSGTVGGSVSLLGGGTLSPGAAASIGTLTLNNLLTLDGATQLNYALLASNTTAGGGINDLVTGVTNLTLAGVLNVAGAGDWTAVAPGTSWRLFDYTGTLTGTSLTFGSMPTLTSGYSFAIDTATPGQVNLTVVPEPSTLAAVGIGAVVAAWGVARRRRRGGR